MVEQKSLSGSAWLQLLALSSIWGASFLSIRLALNEIPFVTAVAHRVFWAMLLLWLYVIWRKFDVPRGWRIWAAFFVMGLLNNVVPFSLMAWGQLHIETGLTSILNAATALFGVLVAAMVFSDERLTPGKLIGSILGFLGVATAIGLETLAQFDLRSAAQLAVLGGTLSYAFAGAWARKQLSQLTPQVAAAGMLTGSSIIMVPAAFLIDGVPSANLSATTLAAIGYFSIIATALAYLLYYRILASAGSGNLMICTLLVAPIAIVLGALILGESLHPRAYAGFAVLTLGLVILDGRILRLHGARR